MSDLSDQTATLPEALIPSPNVFTPSELQAAFPTFSAAASAAEGLAHPKPTELLALRHELESMKQHATQALANVKTHFEQYKLWMCKAYGVSNVRILIEHERVRQAAELAAEEAANQGNSKQHQRIRALAAQSSAASASTEKSRLVLKVPEGLDDSASSDGTSSITSSNSVESVGDGSGGSALAHPTPRSAKTLSRMHNHPSSPPPSSTTTSTAVNIGQGHGQKDLSTVLSSKPKVANQTPINVFWHYVEPFFKPIDEDDLRLLDDCAPGASKALSGVDTAAFMIPPLGMHYKDIWYEQYGYVVPEVNGVGSKKRRQAADGRGPALLKERLLAALIDKDASMDMFVGDGDEADSESVAISDANLVVDVPAPVNDRIRQQLSKLGFADLSVAQSFDEDDEICVEMRLVQRQLRHQIALNQYRKRRLAEFIRSQLAAQEFYSLLEDIERQIDGIFQKRMKATKGSRKKAKMGNVASDAAADAPSMPPPPAEAWQCLENRSKLLESFKALLPSRGETICPVDRVDFDPEIEQEIAEVSKSSLEKWLPLPDMPLRQPLQLPQPAFPICRLNK